MTLIADPRLVWVDAMWIDDKGNLLMPASQLNRTAGLNGGIDAVKPPIILYKLAIGVKGSAAMSRVALVAGAGGIIGKALLEEIARTPGWRGLALSRSGGDVSADLTDPAATRDGAGSGA